MNKMDVIIKTIFFTIFVPSTVVLFIPLLLSTFWDQQIELGILRIGGVLLIGIGCIFYGFSVLSFQISGKGTPMIFFMEKLEKIFGVEPDELVKKGLYRYSRNPMYLGVIILILGEGIVFQSPIIIVWAIVTFLIFHLVVCFLEEPHLKKKHGEKYEEYLKLTPRWIGILKSNK